MLSDEFSKVFAGLTERLDMFFHNKLRDAGINENREDLKNDLMQETALAVLLKLEKEKYNDYSLLKLIWIKAKDVWIEYIKSLKKTNFFVQGQDKELSMIPIQSDAFDLTEHRQWLASVKVNSDIQSWDFLELHTEGFLYKDIAEHFGRTEGVIKMRIQRLKANIKRKGRY